MIHFPLLKACRASGTISNEHIGCWSPNSSAFLPPKSVCGLVMELLSPLRVESEARISASRELNRKKLLPKPAYHKTTARPSTSLCSLLDVADLCCQVLKSRLAFQPLQPQTRVTGSHLASCSCPGPWDKGQEGQFRARKRRGK